MSRTFSDKVIDRHALGEFSDTIQRVKLSAVVGHDATIALIVDEFYRRNLSIWDPERVLFSNDHFSPPATAERADVSNKFLAFARECHIKHLLIDRGIFNQLLIEHRLCQPGDLIVGADSHTIMGGALGACATGMGSTDILFALATGTTWLHRPRTIKVVFKGKMCRDCSGRDVVLDLLRRFGERGANYRSLEFHDNSDEGLSIDDRCAIAGMAVEMGAKFGVFIPDEITADFCQGRDGERPPELLRPDDDAVYEDVIEVNLTNIGPLVAKPYTPANVSPISEINTEVITTALIGSCAGGRLSDLRDAAEVLDGRRVHPHVRLVVIPASVKVLRDALQEGCLEKLLQAGAVLNQPSCGPCGGIDKGVLGANDVCVSTSTRNYRGRMGHWNSRTYLASARTVALAALAGQIDRGLYSV